MPNRLKAYVRRTILNAAREYTGLRRTQDSTRNALIDAQRGTDTGWWNDLIYTADMLDMAHRYRADIVTAVREYMDETGLGYGDAIGRPEDHLSLGVIIDAAAERITWERYNASADAPVNRSVREDVLCDAKLFGLRFAVEWYAGQLPGELGIEL